MVFLSRAAKGQFIRTPGTPICIFRCGETAMGILTDEQVHRLRARYPDETQENSTLCSRKGRKEPEKHEEPGDHIALGQDEPDQISKLVLPDAGQSIDGDSLRNLRKPGVYILMKGQTVLYVGLGISLMGRLAGPNHKQSNKAIAQCDKVLMYPCVSAKAADELETILISRLQPKYNWNKKWVDKLNILGMKQGHREKIRRQHAPGLPSREEFMKDDNPLE
jgi:hypothetical protein